MYVSLHICPNDHIHLVIKRDDGKRIGEAVLSRKEAAELAEGLLRLALPEDARERIQ